MKRAKELEFEDIAANDLEQDWREVHEAISRNKEILLRIKLEEDIRIKLYHFAKELKQAKKLRDKY